MKLNFRKIASVLSSAVMVSSTVALAAAATYPAPFVKSGQPNVAIVFGQNAPLDLAAVINLNNDLNSRLVGQTGGSSGSSSGSSSVSGGDYIKLQGSSDKLNLGDTVTTVLGSAILTESKLPVLLEKGTYTNDENSEYKYEQKITLGPSMTLNFFSDSDYKDRKPSVGINLASGANILNYSVEFNTEAESDLSSGDLVDLETTTIKILGHDYFILDAKNNTFKLTLLDSANSAIATEGETTSVTVDGKTYDISIEFISTSQAKLNVNGEVTNSLSVGGTQRLSDGSYIGVKEILARDVQGAIGKVEFSIGSGKLELTDGSQVKLNDKTISEISTRVTRGTAASASREKISRLTLVWTTDDKRFIAPGSDLVMPGFGNIKLSMANFFAPSTEVTEVVHGSSDYMTLKTTIKDGAITLPILYANASGEFTGIGKDANNRLLTSAVTNVVFNESRDEYLVASWNSSRDSESYVISFTNIVEDLSANANKTDIKVWRNGGWETPYTEKKAGDTVSLGSITLTINSVTKASGIKLVNVTTSSGGSFDRLYTAAGLRILLPVEATDSNGLAQTANGAINFTAASTATGHNPDSYVLFIGEENKDGNVGAGSAFNVTLNDDSDGRVKVSTYDVGRTIISDPEDSDHKINHAYSDLATKVEQLGDSSSQQSAKITYAGGEAYGELYLTTGDATVSSGTEDTSDDEETTTTTSVKSLGDIAVNDNEVASVSNKNLIVVGGSCINSVAAELLGVSYPTCGSAWESATGVGAGSFLVQTFARSGSNVATLVAGYNADDTKNAVKKLTTEPSKFDITAGKKFKGDLQSVAMVDVTSTAA